ncbi:MAG: MFS transporter [Dehalococcoidia bacterium]|nr:MFS transporter [Dehalococcoidia bacterium]
MKRLPTVWFPMPARLYYGWVIVAVALLMNMAAAGANPVVFSFFISPMSTDLGWSRSSLTWAVTFQLVTGGAIAPLLGMLVDKIGARWLGVMAGLIAGVSIMSLSLVHHLWMVYALFALSGAGGFGGPGAALLTIVPVAKWFQVKRGRAVAIASVGMPAGTVLCIPLAQWLISAYGWRTAWVVFGVVVSAVVIPACGLFMRKVPEDLGLKPDGVTDTASPAQAAKARPSLATAENWSAKQVLRSPTMWLVLVAMAMAGMVLNGTLIYRVSFWEDIGMSPGLVAFGTALDPFTVVFSGIAFGLVAERLVIRYLGLIGGVGFGLAMLPMVFATSHAYSIAAHGVIWGASAGAYITVNNLVWPNYFGRKSLGTIQGIVLPVTVLASGLGAPLYGYLLDSGINPRVVWTGTSVVFAVVGALLLLAKRPRLSKAVSRAG